MKNSLIKNILFISIVSAVAIGLSLLIEYFYFNRNVRNINSNDRFDVVNTKDIIKEGSYFKTTSEEAYLILKPSSNDKYVNKINFKYETDNNFDWYYSINDTKDLVYNKSGHIINKAIRPINQEVKTIKIGFIKSGIKIKDFKVNNKIYINYSRVIFMILTLVSIALFIYYIGYFKNNLDKAFLFIALISGITMFVVSPKTINTYLDDRTHLMHSHSLFNSNKVKVSKAIMIEEATTSSHQDLYTTQEEQLQFYKSLNKIGKEKVTVQVNNYSPKYNKFIYIPFYIGIKIGNLLNLSFIFTMVLARFLNFLIYVLIMYFAIKISTNMKNIMFILSLAVSRIFCATQFTYDTIIVALLLFALALFFKMLEKKKITKKYIILFILCIVIGSLSKAVYSPLLLLLLFVSDDKFDHKKQAKYLKTLIVVLTMIMLSTYVLPVLLGTAGGDIRGGNTGATGQIAYILSNPLSFSKTMAKFIIQNIGYLTLGQQKFIDLAYLGDSIEPIAGSLYIIYLLLLLKTVFSTKIDSKILSEKMKIVFGSFFIMFLIFIPLCLYLIFTPIGLTTINGVQSRYFYPILPLLLITLIPYNLKDKNLLLIKSYKLLLILIPFFILIITNFYILYKGIGI